MQKAKNGQATPFLLSNTERNHSILRIWNGATPFSHIPKPNITLASGPRPERFVLCLRSVSHRPTRSFNGLIFWDLGRVLAPPCWFARDKRSRPRLFSRRSDLVHFWGKGASWILPLCLCDGEALLDEDSLGSIRFPHMKLLVLFLPEICAWFHDSRVVVFLF
jgi:hypothetical protein